jgi:NhaP-type Na+/H+ or K+/H+ antiporter
LVFGEGIVNDAVAIILFTTMTGFVEEKEVFSAVTPFKIIGDFLLLTLISLAIGVFFGLLCSMVLKYFRFITTSSVKETVTIFAFGYLAYGTGEVFH